MDWTRPIKVTLTADATPMQRLSLFIGHFDCRFYLNDDAYIDVGAGSLALIDNVHVGPDRSGGMLGEIGRWCEFHQTARIQVRGAHANQRPVNITFSALSVMGGFGQGLDDPAPFSIGNGVVLSAGVHVLDGAIIGDGSVVGAGAVVAGSLDARSIFGGVPARKIGSRPEFAPWWDFEVSYLLANKAGLQDLAADVAAAHIYRAEKPKFAVRLAGGALSITGFVERGALKPLDEAPEPVRNYLVQAFSDEAPYWLADCWPD
jgi:acetyltransferase-like isoleucine patch superfamily enzyme